MYTKRLRLFAGPNGSGKTTILERIPKELYLGYVVNADDIEKRIKEEGKYPLSEQNIETSTELLQDYFRNDGFSKHKLNDSSYIDKISVLDDHIQLPAQLINSYIAADIAGFFRTYHLEHDHSFTFESVLSHPSKLNLLQTAKAKGYRIYLYYIATESPDICLFQSKSIPVVQSKSIPFKLNKKVVLIRSGYPDLMSTGARIFRF